MKNFFEEKKRTLKFKLAGQGHKLNEPAPESSSSSATSNPPVEKRVDNKESQDKRSAVLAAALQRSLETANKNIGSKKRFAKSDSTSSSSRLECTDKPSGNENSSAEAQLEAENAEDVFGVFFKCPSIGAETVLPRKAWKELIQKHINELRSSDPILASILAMKSLNPQKETDQCIAIIIKYLRNLIQFPDNDKYKCIRMGNAKFSESVLSVEGALDFLSAVGFCKELIQGDNPEYHLVYKPDSPPDLESLIQSLLEISGLDLILDREFKMLSPSEIVMNDTIVVTDDFFELTVHEIKREQRSRSMEVEKNSVLMTKKMREMEKMKNSSRRKALFTKIRIKLPNEFVIQGTFSVEEKFKSLREFIDEKLEINSTYTFMAPPNQFIKAEDEEKTFAELGLHPAVKLILEASEDNFVVKLKE